MADLSVKPEVEETNGSVHSEDEDIDSKYRKAYLKYRVKQLEYKNAPITCEICHIPVARANLKGHNMSYKHLCAQYCPNILEIRKNYRALGK